MASAVYFILLHNVTNLAETWWWRACPSSQRGDYRGGYLYSDCTLKNRHHSQNSAFCQQVIARITPLRNLLKTSRRNVCRGLAYALAENGRLVDLSGFSDQASIVGVVGLDKSVGTLCLMSAVVVGAIMVPIAGWLTDRFGRVLVYRSLAIFQLLITFPVWVASSATVAVPDTHILFWVLGIGAWVCLVHKVLFCLNSLVLAIVILASHWQGKFSAVIAGWDRANCWSAIISFGDPH